MTSFDTDGCYRIGVPGGEFLTLEDAAGDSSPVQTLPPNGSGEQEWKIHPADHGTCTITNVRSKTFLGFAGEPDHNVLVGGSPEPRAWQLAPVEEPDRFVVGAPGTELVLGRSPMRIHPPRTALVEPIGEATAWHFQLVGQVPAAAAERESPVAPE
ncbi:RICIN domain-containing protein [Streptomyces sp. NPDC055287]